MKPLLTVGDRHLDLRLDMQYIKTLVRVRKPRLNVSPRRVWVATARKRVNGAGCAPGRTGL